MVENQPCKCCGRVDCICPACPICGLKGCENCYKEHDMFYTEQQLEGQNALLSRLIKTKEIYYDCAAHLVDEIIKE